MHVFSSSLTFACCLHIPLSVTQVCSLFLTFTLQHTIRSNRIMGVGLPSEFSVLHHHRHRCLSVTQPSNPVLEMWYIILRTTHRNACSLFNGGMIMVISPTYLFRKVVRVTGSTLVSCSPKENALLPSCWCRTWLWRYVPCYHQLCKFSADWGLVTQVRSRDRNNVKTNTLALVARSDKRRVWWYLPDAGWNVSVTVESHASLIGVGHHSTGYDLCTVAHYGGLFLVCKG